LFLLFRGYDGARHPSSFSEGVSEVFAGFLSGLRKRKMGRPSKAGPSSCRRVGYSSLRRKSKHMLGDGNQTFQLHTVRVVKLPPVKS
jgi:hypothetical protein